MILVMMIFVINDIGYDDISYDDIIQWIVLPLPAFWGYALPPWHNPCESISGDISHLLSQPSTF
jgi:hypothetical protein